MICARMPHALARLTRVEEAAKLLSYTLVYESGYPLRLRCYPDRMEHLLLPSGAFVSRSEKAPYIADLYDGGPFLEYPSRSRFTHIWDVYMPAGKPASSYNPRVNESLLEDLQTFLQTWFFFGMLHEFFGDKASPSQFLENDRRIDSGLEVDVRASRGNLTTASLGPLIDEWAAAHQGLKTTDPLFIHLAECTNRAWDICALIWRAQRDSIPLVHFWSIGSLVETLACALESLTDSHNLNRPWIRFLKVDTIAEQMTSAGHCPTDVTKWFENAGNFQTLYFLSKLEQPATKDHQSCSGSVCSAVQYDMSGGKALHRCQNRDCGEFHVDNDKIMRILEDGYISLLDITIGDELDTLNVNVISSQTNQAYVALSHVWADGLGNPFANALPRCQLAYLAKLVSGLDDATDRKEDGKLLLWLDTLCCPVASPKHRNICLLRVQDIYKDAAHVLVLDAQLAKYDAKSIDGVEICCRLIHSTWMRRLWTLQEAALNQSLWVQLQDWPVSVNSIIDGMSALHLMHQELRKPLLGKLKRLRDFFFPNREQNRNVNIHQLRAGLESRLVSVPTDEPLCLSTLMRLDQSKLIEVRPEDRMREFWLAFGESGMELSSSILYFHGQRVQHLGLRLAPASLLEKTDMWSLRTVKTPEDRSKIVPQGLLVQFTSCKVVIHQQLSTEDQQLVDGILMELAPSLPFWIRGIDGAFYLVLTCGNQCHDPATTPAIREVMRRNHGRNIFLQEKPIQEMGNVFGNDDIAFAICGTRNGQENEITQFRMQTALILMKMNDRLACILEAAWQHAQDLELQNMLHAIQKTGHEIPIRPDSAGMSRLPNHVVARVQELAEHALKDGQLIEAMHPQSEKVMLKEMAEDILVFAGGWCAEVQQTWPSLQTWCID